MGWWFTTTAQRCRPDGRQHTPAKGLLLPSAASPDSPSRLAHRSSRVGRAAQRPIRVGTPSRCLTRLAFATRAAVNPSRPRGRSRGTACSGPAPPRYCWLAARRAPSPARPRVRRLAGNKDSIAAGRSALNGQTPVTPTAVGPRTGQGVSLARSLELDPSTQNVLRPKGPFCRAPRHLRARARDPAAWRVGHNARVKPWPP